MSNRSTRKRSRGVADELPGVDYSQALSSISEEGGAPQAQGQACASDAGNIEEMAHEAEEERRRSDLLRDLAAEELAGLSNAEKIMITIGKETLRQLIQLNGNQVRTAAALEQLHRGQNGGGGAQGGVQGGMGSDASDTQLKFLLRPGLGPLVEQHGHYPSDHVLAEASFLASGAADFHTWRAAHPNYYVRLLKLAGKLARQEFRGRVVDKLKSTFRGCFTGDSPLLPWNTEGEFRPNAAAALLAGARYRTGAAATPAAAAPVTPGAGPLVPVVNPYGERRYRECMLRVWERPEGWFTSNPEEACTGAPEEIDNPDIPIRHIYAPCLALLELVASCLLRGMVDLTELEKDVGTSLSAQYSIYLHDIKANRDGGTVLVAPRTAPPLDPRSQQ